ncbi:MAG: PaaI family thioesterase [Myxococcales bacterium]|nr:PaaI family thioesterase [Myxococcales bacterium]
MGRAIGETWTNDGPDATCFGCGHRNERGLRMVFTRTGERGIESRYQAEPHQCGAPGVVHGGIQAALLDEVLGTAGHLGFDAPDVDIATVDFSLRYRRPCPAGETLVIAGELQRVEGRDVFVSGQIRNLAGDVLTEAEARWRRLRPRS